MAIASGSGAGASSADVAKLTACVVDRTPDKIPRFPKGAARVTAAPGTIPVPPASLPGVQTLDIPARLVGIEATAVLDRNSPARRNPPQGPRKSACSGGR
ncbi:hypothetical protein [Streptomyces sp. GD-15H]|uniref:hypothetical protein n=1 Tax=Streptomyces sp. GD-15H TaxID=3129112 RepID=UPI00387397A5